MKRLERVNLDLLKWKDNYPKIILSLDTLDFSKSGFKHINAEQFLNGKVDL